jgi:hypothetical protein
MFLRLFQPKFPILRYLARGFIIVTLSIPQWTLCVIGIVKCLPVKLVTTVEKYKILLLEFPRALYYQIIRVGKWKAYTFISWLEIGILRFTL